MEVAYCKGRRASMRSIKMWLSEHLSIAEEAQNMGLDDGQVLKLTMCAMRKAEALIAKDLGEFERLAEKEKGEDSETDVLNKDVFKALEAAKLNEYLNNVKK